MDSSAVINIGAVNSQSDTTIASPSTRDTGAALGDTTNNVSHPPSPAAVSASASPSTMTTSQLRGAAIDEDETHFGTLTATAIVVTNAQPGTNASTACLSTSTTPPDASDSAGSTSLSDAPPDMTAEELRTRLEDLPQELYDQIKDLTFAFDFTCSENRRVDRRECKPFMLLQINKSLRTDFIRQYYGAKAPFFFTEKQYKPGNGYTRHGYARHTYLELEREITDWLKTLSKETVTAFPDSRVKKTHMFDEFPNWDDDNTTIAWGGSTCLREWVQGRSPWNGYREIWFSQVKHIDAVLWNLTVACSQPPSISCTQ